MAMFGFFALVVAFIATASGIFFFILSAHKRKTAHTDPPKASFQTKAGCIATFVLFGTLTLCCTLLVVCFVNGNNSIEYVVQYRSNSTSDIAWLYILSGLWAGRQGSLLFWAWLISAFAVFVIVRNRKKRSALDDWAQAIISAVILAFVSVLLFSESNMPFKALSPLYFDESGNLTNGAQFWSLSPLLEHWAMSIHPPTLFVGYAGLTIPFAYALAALIVNDDSDRWILRVNGITAFSWLFLGIGIGLGAVWAYVVLGWGGYWGWDPVENASLLSWLVCVALMHCFTVYRKRNIFKRWSIVCACLAFMFVIVGTFISRSGIVQSVHAFEGDSVSLYLFSALIFISFIAAIAGTFVRRGTFSAPASEQNETISSKEMAYYLTNVVMVLGSFILVYMTVSSALPTWLPAGGTSISAGTYNAIARPISILFFLVVALCPLLSWRKLDIKTIIKNIRVYLIVAGIIFALLLAYFIAVLFPIYEATIMRGGSLGTDLAAYGPAWYYHALALGGFAVAALLMSTSIFMLKKNFVIIRKNPSTKKTLQSRALAFGGSIAHFALGVILIGLIGSSMYVNEKTGYLASEGSTTAADSFIVGAYEFRASGESQTEEGPNAYQYELTLDMYKEGEFITQVHPSILVDGTTMQQKLQADVVSYLDHDVFVVFRGFNTNFDYSLDIRVNPLISFVWTGFALLATGTFIAMFARRKSKEDSHE